MRGEIKRRIDGMENVPGNGHPCHYHAAFGDDFGTS
jgi:hypothetical protein